MKRQQRSRAAPVRGKGRDNCHGDESRGVSDEMQTAASYFPDF
ncbi:MAG: hypothetical protein V3R96_02595 [Dehalococcoidales bacterium]